MVETTIRTVDQNVSFKAVHASRGKILRAEPISALFDQRRAHLVGVFPELEDQMATYAAGSPGSPDRLDAMVWSLTELMVDNCQYTDFLEYMRREVEKMRAAERTVRLHAPASVAPVVRLTSGRVVAVPADRIVELSEADARPLVQWAGWRLAEGRPRPGPRRAPGAPIGRGARGRAGRGRHAAVKLRRAGVHPVRRRRAFATCRRASRRWREQPQELATDFSGGRCAAAASQSAHG